jgi:predicted outer membrane protein
MRTARALHLPVPITLSGRAQARIRQLEQAANGEAFDDAYVELMLLVHRETMAAHLAFAANPGRASLMQASREARTRVQDHIDQLEKVVLSLQPPSMVQDTPPPARTVSPWPEDAVD